MKYYKLLNDLGVNPSVAYQYEILCLPQNIEHKNQSKKSELVDSAESITLSKLLKEKGVKCANSYDLSLDSKISENRSIDLWLGSIWILNHAALPLFVSVAGPFLWEKIKQMKQSQKVDDTNTEKTTVHANLVIVDGPLSADIKYEGDADTFLKVVKGIKDE